MHAGNAATVPRTSQSTEDGAATITQSDADSLFRGLWVPVGLYDPWDMP